MGDTPPLIYLTNETLLVGENNVSAGSVARDGGSHRQTPGFRFWGDSHECMDRISKLLADALRASDEWLDKASPRLLDTYAPYDLDRPGVKA